MLVSIIILLSLSLFALSFRHCQKERIQLIFENILFCLDKISHSRCDISYLVRKRQIKILNFFPSRMVNHFISCYIIFLKNMRLKTFTMNSFWIACIFIQKNCNQHELIEFLILAVIDFSWFEAVFLLSSNICQ